MPKKLFAHVYGENDTAAVFFAMTLVNMEYYSFYSITDYGDGIYDVWFERIIG